jgi:hypothetical protein
MRERPRRGSFHGVETTGMSNRTALQTAIAELVDGFEAAGKVIDVNSAALHLSSKYPQSGMTIDEICRQIEESAVRSRATLLSGMKPSSE